MFLILLSVFVVFFCLSVCVCVVEYIERCFLYVCLCVYIYLYIILHLKHSILRCVHELLCITLCVYVCVCPLPVPACCLHLDPRVFLSIFYQFMLVSVFCFFQLAWSFKNPFVMISLVVSVVVVILWECSHILMKDCSGQSQPLVVVIVSPMST